MQKKTSRFKRLLSLILAAALCLSVLPTSVLAADGDATVTYTQVTSAADVTAGGQLVLVAESEGVYYALGNTIGSKITAAEVSVVDGTVTAENLPVWTAAPAADGISLSNGAGYLAYGSSTNFTSGAEAYEWDVSAAEGLFRFTASGSSTRGIAYGVSQAKFGAYSTANASGYVFDLLVFKAGGSPDPVVTVETPTATYSEAEETVTFACATAGVVYFYNVNGGEYTALEGNVLDVSGCANGAVIGYYAQLGDAKSAAASITIARSGGDVDEKDVVTIAEARAAAVGTENITVEGTVILVSGKNVYVQDETGGIDLFFAAAPADIAAGSVVRATGTRASYNGLEELSGVTEYTVLGTDGALPSRTVTIAELLGDQETGALESTRVRIENAVIGAVNTGGNTTLTQDGSSINIYRIPALDGIEEGDTVSLYAVVSDFKGYQLLVGSAADVTLVSKGGEEEPSKPASGSYVIWAPAYHMALSSNYNGFYNVGVEVSEGEDGTLTGYADTEVWNVTANADGTYTIAYGGQNLAMADSYSSLTLGEANDQWTLEDAGNGLYYVKNVARGCYIEWYASKNNWSGYNRIAAGSEGMFALKFTPVEQQPVDPDAVTGTLAGTLAAGDQVAIYYPNGRQAISGTANGSKLTGVDAAVEGELLTTTKDALILTVRITGEGYYTFENEGRYLTSGATGSSLTLGEKSDYSLWQLESAEGGYYIKNVNAKYGSRNQYIEYYNGFTTYSFSTSNPAIYTYQFYKTGSVSVAAEYDTDPSLVGSIAQWGGGGPYDESNNEVVYGDKYEVGDMKDASAAFTIVANGQPGKPYQKTSTSTGGSNYYMGGENIGKAEGDYMQLAVSTAGWGDMSLSFRLRATNAAPGSFQLQYSADGGNTFENFTAGSYSYAYTKYSSTGTSIVSDEGTISDGVARTSLAPTYYVSFCFDVPAGAENAETLLIRLVAGTQRANGAAGTPGGNIRIDSVELYGSPIVDDSVTGYVTVTPDGVEEDQAPGTVLTMTTATENAVILYRFVDPNGDGSEEWLTYNVGSKPALPDTLPAVLEVKAVSEGRADSITRILRYAAGTVQAVKMSPNGGGVYVAGDPVEVVLSCATEGAVIFCNTGAVDGDGNEIYAEYDPENAPILLEKGFGALTIKAYAEKEGFKDSAVTTRNFTERASETYNIYFGQLHSHTSYSDGAGSAEDAYQHASNVENLDFLAVTDHSNSFDNAADASLADGSMSEEWVEGHALARKYTTDKFVGLFGFEMTWSNGLGHINTYNTDGFQSRTQAAFSTYATALQNYYGVLKTDSDSISQFNHPGTTFGDFSDFAYFDEEIDQLITLIEVGNGEGAIGSSGYFPSYEYYTRALDKGWHVAPTNNQDNHKGLWGDANTARSVVLADSLTEADIYDAMRNYRVYATEDNDLSIYYTLNGYTMGSILTESDVDDTVTLSVKLKDPTDSSIGKVEVIVNGGYSLASQTVAGSEDTVTFTVGADYSYYYIKVTEADGDIAVTAPVWVGAVEAVGISGFSTNAPLAVQNQALDLTLDLYNNETTAFEVESIVFTIDDQVIHTADLTNLSKVGSMDTASYTFSYTHGGLGATNIYATVTGTLNGVTKVYQELLQLDYVSPEMVTRVVVDGTHYNDYVTGYYGGNMNNFVTIAAGKSVEVSVVTDQITAETLEDCALLVISAPAKKTGTANAGDFVPSAFEDGFIRLVVDYVKNGGSVVVCGLADYQDDKTDPAGEYHSSVQINKLLEAIGSTMRINDDEVYDPVNNGGQFYRLYPAVFNADSVWTEGIVDGQTYSQYSGCSVDPGEGEWLVRGFDTTYSVDSDKDGRGNTDEKETDDSYNYNIVTPKGEVVFLASEATAYGGTVFAAGGVFLSDFEVQAEMDNIWDLPYANRTIAENILDAVTVELPLSTIAEVRAAGNAGNRGDVYRVQGYVTAGTAVEANTFFDCIYIQDETGGLDIFPYAEAGLEIGTRIEVVGYLADYQGDLELKVMSCRILDEEPYVYEPEKMSCADAMDYASNGGRLIQAEGIVKEGSLAYNADGTLAQFVVVDEAGGEAKVFIDGYILSASTGKNELASFVKAGARVSAVGLLYMHPEGNSDESVAVLRVRNCDEVKLISAGATDPEDPGKPADPGVSTDPGTGSSSAVTSPNTGDSANIVLWVVLLLCAAGALIGWYVVQKRRQNK